MQPSVRNAGNLVTRFEAVRNDADVNVFAAPDQEFWSIPVERLVRKEPARPVIDCCELSNDHTAREHLGDAAWSEK